MLYRRLPNWHFCRYLSSYLPAVPTPRMRLICQHPPRGRVPDHPRSRALRQSDRHNPIAAAEQIAPTPVPLSPITPPNTALPSPACVPTHIDSGAPAAAGWVSTPSGWTVSWTAADAPYLDEYFSTTTMYPLPGVATMSVSEGGVSKTIAPTIGVWTSSGGRADIWEISPSDGKLAVTKAQLDAAVHSALPSATTYHVTALSVEVRDVHSTGCGATAISTLTVGGSITTP